MGQGIPGVYMGYYTSFFSPAIIWWKGLYTDVAAMPEKATGHVADALNHYNAILSGPNHIHVKIGSKYYVRLPNNQSDQGSSFHPDVITTA